ncbi:MAG: hypothetical protein WCD16_15765 [Paracoccaceae bacterium]
MFRFLLPIALILAACAGPLGGRPEKVIVSRDMLTDTLSSGARCFGPRAGATQTAAGWSGTLENCGAAYPYEVTLLPGTNPVRYVLSEVLTALGGETLIAPLAAVEITTPNRVYRFRSPPPRDPQEAKRK